MKGTTLIDTRDANLAIRGYELGNRITSNLIHVLTGEDLEHWEAHLGDIKEAIWRGFSLDHISAPTSLPPGFTLLKEYPMAVPADYQHEGYLGRFRAANTSGFIKYGITSILTDANYRNPSHRLVPGKTYLAKQYAITRQVSSVDCLKAYAYARAYKAGAQGAAMHWELCCKELPSDKLALSFDEEERLPLIGDYHRVPSVCRYWDGFVFGNGYFEYPWYNNYVLVLLCDFPAKGGA